MKKTLLALLLAFCLSGFAQDEERVPKKPMQLEVAAEYKGADSIAVLKWRDMSDNELGFEILRSDNNKEFRVIGNRILHIQGAGLQPGRTQRGIQRRFGLVLTGFQTRI